MSGQITRAQKLEIGYFAQHQLDELNADEGAYSGAVILVSHDRYLIEACADRLWLVADGEVAPFDGDLDDYRRLVLASKSAERVLTNKSADPRRTGRADIRRAAAEKRVELAPLRRRIADTESKIARLNAEIVRIDTALAESGLFARDPAKAAALAKARADTAGALAQAEEDWLEASGELEKERE